MSDHALLPLTPCDPLRGVLVPGGNCIQAVLRSLSDDELLRRLFELLRQSRRVEADLVAHIGEVDERRLYRREAVPSMFVYCTDILNLSEHEAYLRITVGRAAREYPILLPMLAGGRLHLTGIAKLAQHLTVENCDAVLERAAFKSKREIEVLVAELAPRPDAPPVIRRLPECRPVDQAFGPAPEDHTTTTELGPDRVPPAMPVLHPTQRSIPPRPLSLDRYKIQFTVGGAFREKLERLQALMRSSVPDVDLAQIMEQAVTEKLERLEARRFGRAKNPRREPTETPSSSRYVATAVRRAVHDRDAGQCRFVDGQGRRCGARDRLEFHHVNPWARGGGHSVENIRLMCHAHNALLAERDYGEGHMSKYRRASTALPRTSESAAGSSP